MCLRIEDRCGQQGLVGSVNESQLATSPRMPLRKARHKRKMHLQ